MYLVTRMLGFAQKARLVHTTSVQRDSYNYPRMLQRCKTIKCIMKAQARIIVEGHEHDCSVATKLIGKYVQFSIDNAWKVFDRLSERDVFVWNVLIQGYANQGAFPDAVSVYEEMRKSGVAPNQYTFPFVLKACGMGRDKRTGQVVHGLAVRSGYDLDLFVGNALIAFYSKCWDIKSSRKVFTRMLRKDIVSWNSMISGLTVNGDVDEALKVFRAMLSGRSCCLPDRATLVAVLPASAQAAAILEGFWIHCYIIKSGFEVDAALGSGLISMYTNCGRVSIARQVFNRVSDKNIVVWNAMIRCYGMHGFAEEALNMFSTMLEVGVCPDGVIYLCLLSACSHAGMVAKGQELFEQMENYGVEKSEEHYACMVDLLGRAGFLDDAVRLIETMPMKAGKNVYGALLGACRIHNNVELAEEAAEKLFVLDPDNAGRYVLLAKMYGDLGRLEDAARIRRIMREKKIRKPIGCSSIEVDSVHHTFGVEDESHPFTEQIFDTLIRLDKILEEETHD